MLFFLQETKIRYWLVDSVVQSVHIQTEFIEINKTTDERYIGQVTGSRAIDTYGTTNVTQRGRWTGRHLGRRIQRRTRRLKPRQSKRHTGRKRWHRTGRRTRRQMSRTSVLIDYATTPMNTYFSIHTRILWTGIQIRVSCTNRQNWREKKYIPNWI